MIDIQKEVQLLHLSALLAELVDGTRRTHKISDKYTLFMMENRISLVCYSNIGKQQIVSACISKDEDSGHSDDSPFMTLGNIYIYNKYAQTKLQVYSIGAMTKEETEYEVILEDFREESSESTVFQLQTVLNDDHVLGIVLHSQVYNFLLPGMEHYRRTHVDKIELDYDELLDSITKIIEVEHGR